MVFDKTYHVNAMTNGKTLKHEAISYKGNTLIY